MKPLLITEYGFNGANYSLDEIEIKEEPLQDELVSEFYNKCLHNFSLNKKSTSIFIHLIYYAVQC